MHVPHVRTIGGVVMRPNPWLVATTVVIAAAIALWEWRGRDWWLARRSPGDQFVDELWDDFYRSAR